MKKMVTKTGQCVRRQCPRGSPSSGSLPSSCLSCSSHGPSSHPTDSRSPPQSIRQKQPHTVSLGLGVSSRSWLLATFASALGTLRVFVPWTAEAMETGGRFAAGVVPLEAQKQDSNCQSEARHDVDTLL